MSDDAKGQEPITPKPDTKEAGVEETTPYNRDDVEQIVKAAVQSETDKVRGELYTKIRVKDQEIEELKKSKMTESEIRKYKEEQLATRERELAQKELMLAATDALRESGMKNAQDFRDFVLAESPDAIKEKIIPVVVTRQQANAIYASEADLLNVALFGQTAQQWRENNPGKDGNIRDHAELEQLVVLSNLESINALFIHQGLPQSKRLIVLNETAIIQMKSLVDNKRIKKLK